MSKYNYIQNSFSSGEIGFKNSGRTDRPEFAQGVEKCQDFLILRGGGAQKRPGSQYVKDLTDLNFTGSKVIPFIFSKTESYVIVMGDGSFNDIVVYKNDGTLSTVDTDDAQNQTVSSYNPLLWNYSQTGDILILTYGDGTIPPHILLRETTDTFRYIVVMHPAFRTKFPSLPEADKFGVLQVPFLDRNSNSDFIIELDSVSVGTRTVTMTDSSGNNTTYFTRDMEFSTVSSKPGQIGSIFRMSDGTTEGWGYITDLPADLAITDANINTSTDIFTSTAHGLYTRDRVEAKETGAGGDPPTGITIGQIYFVRRVSANTFTIHPTLDDADNNTNIVDVTALNGAGIGFIIVSSSTATIEIVVAPGSGVTSASGGSDNWAESAWSKERGYPGTSALYQQRLVMGGTVFKPDTLFGSLVGNIFHFMEQKFTQDSSSDTSGLNYFGSQVETDPFQLTIASKQLNKIQWMSSHDSLQVGTLGSEYIIDGGPDNILSRDNISIRPQTFIGSKQVQPARVNDSLLFVSLDGKRLMDFFFSGQVRSFTTRNMNIYNEEIVFHEFDGASSSSFADIEFTDISWQESRGILWCVTSNGSLVGLTIDRDNQTLAWHKHIIGGTSRQVLSIASIPAPDGETDELWMVVSRTINESTENYLEKIGGEFGHSLLVNSSSNNNDRPWFTDSSIRLTLDTAQTFTDSDVELPTNTIDVSVADLDSLRDLTKVQFTTTGTLPTGS